MSRLALAVVLARGGLGFISVGPMPFGHCYYPGALWVTSYTTFGKPSNLACCTWIGSNSAGAAHDTHLVQRLSNVLALLGCCGMRLPCLELVPMFQVLANRMSSAVVTKRFVAK